MAPTDHKLTDGGSEFQGPEKRLTLCFKTSKLRTRSLRLITRESWEAVLKHAQCTLLSSCESTSSVVVINPEKSKRVNTKGVTAFLLSGSSLLVADNILSWKTCGLTTPVIALEPILDLVIPSWRSTNPEHFLKYVSFTRLSCAFPEQQLPPQSSWQEEISYLGKYFCGDSVQLGSATKSTFHAYVANYLPKGDVIEAFSTQVCLTNLDEEHRAAAFSCAADHTSPLRGAWVGLHGNEARSPAARAVIDEHFFKPVGYSANAVFGPHFTTVHATPQAQSPSVSIETSLPLMSDARAGFIQAAESMCKAHFLSFSEFAMSPSLFIGGPPPEIHGFKLEQTSQTIGSAFACAHHYYSRIFAPIVAVNKVLSLPCSQGQVPRSHTINFNRKQSVPQICIRQEQHPEVAAAEFFWQDSGIAKADTPKVLLDLGMIKRKANQWHRLLPRVEPFYAIKCNPYPLLVETLWDQWKTLGAGGFDCASPSEMDVACAVGVDPAEDTIFANPCKQSSAIEHARRAGVRRLVFDNLQELDKIKSIYPSAALLLRVQTDDAQAQCPLSNKFGAATADARVLLARAQELHLNVIGVSFHVGSGTSQKGVFKHALQRARAVFDEAERQGIEFSILDIGGGFPGWDEDGQVSFADHAADINDSLAQLFPETNLQVIAEPGRFFAASAQALLTTVIAIGGNETERRYYLNDGVYGSFNCLIYDHAVVPVPTIMRQGRPLLLEEGEPTYTCTLFGPTCDGFDLLSDSIHLPLLKVGDQLIFKDMGAYTSAASSTFNGFSQAEVLAYESLLEVRGFD